MTVSPNRLRSPQRAASILEWPIWRAAQEISHLRAMTGFLKVFDARHGINSLRAQMARVDNLSALNVSFSTWTILAMPPVEVSFPPPVARHAPCCKKILALQPMSQTSAHPPLAHSCPPPVIPLSESSPFALDSLHPHRYNPPVSTHPAIVRAAVVGLECSIRDGAADPIFSEMPIRLRAVSKKQRSEHAFRLIVFNRSREFGPRYSFRRAKCPS